MLRAVYSFRPEKGYLFQTFASRVSENAMMDYVRKCVSAIPTTGQMLSLDIEPCKQSRVPKGESPLLEYPEGAKRAGPLYGPTLSVPFELMLLSDGI